MKILMISKYPPIQGGVSADCYWTAQVLAEMGNEVCVLTNALEVEDEYRIRMTQEDEALLTGFRKPNSVQVISTTIDKNHLFAPQVNPSVSKLLSLGLELVEKVRPDLLWSHYLEPYGVVAYLLSRITGVPYVFRHAGSDIGRLMLTSQLRSLHHEVLRNARLILTRPVHHQRFLEIGIPKERMADSVSLKLPPDLFFERPFAVRSPITLGVYGKTGESKGTGALLDAIEQLNSDGFAVRLRAHWGGKHLDRYLSRIKNLEALGLIDNGGFITHWRIPDFIRSCDAILFLESRFSITFHHPSIPLESVTCGRPVIVTTEVAKKHFYDGFLVDGSNAIILDGDVNVSSVGAAIRRFADTFSAREQISTPQMSIKSELTYRVRMYGLLERVRANAVSKECL